MKGTLDTMKQIEEEKMKLKEQTDSLQANVEVRIKQSWTHSYSLSVCV